MSATSIDPATTIGTVHLAVSDLERAAGFYREVLGFRVTERTAEAATLSAGGTTPLLTLTALPDARPKPRRSTGLYHFAVLMPDRAALSRSLLRLTTMRYPLEGASDHLVSEALYLSDPDGNGIELYRDRPRGEWPVRDGQLMMATEHLDLDALLNEAVAAAEPWEGLDPRTRIGHIHLHVAEIAPAIAFYRDTLGFDLMLRFGPSAAFLSAGGYHHHIGINTWAGVGAPPPPANAVGLRWFDVLVPDAAALEAVRVRLEANGAAYETRDGALALRDPSGNAVRVRAAA
jgi:catechol 2,3-dioxygenase